MLLHTILTTPSDMSWPLIILIAAFVLIGVVTHCANKTRPSDLDAISEFAHLHQLRDTNVRRSYNHWRYWIGGRPLLSNISRIFVLTGTTHDGSVIEYHLAFDPLAADTKPQMLQERRVNDA